MSNKTQDLIKESEARWVDLRFTDTKGKEQHVSIPISEVGDDFFVEGKMFDGSSIAGWKGINESDMILMPDDSTAVLDGQKIQRTSEAHLDLRDLDRVPLLCPSSPAPSAPCRWQAGQCAPLCLLASVVALCEEMEGFTVVPVTTQYLLLLSAPVTLPLTA